MRSLTSWRILTLLSLSLCWSASTQADGKLLQKYCSAVPEFQQNPVNFNRGRDLGYCLGLLKGIREMNHFYELKSPKQAYFCLNGTSLTNQRAAQLVLDYLQQHPEHLERNDSVVVIQAFRSAFPCH